MCVCVCVCACERERERESVRVRERERETDRERQRETERDRERERTQNSECFIVEGHLTHYKWYDYKHARGEGRGGGIRTPALLLSGHRNKGREYTVEITPITPILEITFKV